MKKDRHQLCDSRSGAANNSLMVRIFALSSIAALMVLGTPRTTLADASRISAADAIHFVGQAATVCGRVASAKYAASANGEPTFLNLDEPYPNQVFTIVIWGKNRAAFPYAPESLAHRRVCVTGKIELYREKAEIAVSAPGEIKVVD